MKIWGCRNLTDHTQLAEYTDSNPAPSTEQWTVDLVIACKQGSHYVPGTFEMLTRAGRRVEQFNRSYPRGGQIDLSGALIAGERRQGSISFDVPVGEQVTKVVLFQGSLNPPAAFWTVSRCDDCRPRSRLPQQDRFWRIRDARSSPLPGRPR
ncbi:hypothetical protein ACWEQA_18820 [Nocardia sp. NPDC004085]